MTNNISYPSNCEGCQVQRQAAAIIEAHNLDLNAYIVSGSLITDSSSEVTASYTWKAVANDRPHLLHDDPDFEGLVDSDRANTEIFDPLIQELEGLGFEFVDGHADETASGVLFVHRHIRHTDECLDNA